MVCPREYIGGNVALTATAATFSPSGRFYSATARQTGAAYCDGLVSEFDLVFIARTVEADTRL